MPYSNKTSNVAFCHINDLDQPVQSDQSSLWAYWIAKDIELPHADSQNCQDWADTQAD